MLGKKGSGMKEAISKFRESKGLSRYQLARMSGLLQETLKTLEERSKGTSYKNLVILSYLLFGGDYKKLGKALEAEIGRSEVNKIKKRLGL